MARLSGRQAFAAALALAALGCGPSGSTGLTITPLADAGVDVDEPAPLVCADASPEDVAAYEVLPAPLLCGGELAVAGPTPFGWWVPKVVRAVFELGDCLGLSLSFGDENDAMSGLPKGAHLYFKLPQAKTQEPWSGTFKVTGGLIWGAGRFVNVPITVEITSATALFTADAGASAQPMNGVGPIGHVTGSIDADTGCGHVTGTFSLPYCGWSTCI